MNIQKNEEAIAHQNTSTCVAYEYSTSADEINAAVIELAGRYPDDGWVRNLVCTSLIHVIQGSGHIEGECGTTELAAGDQVLIVPGEKYAFGGSMKLLYVASPAWAPEQAEHVQ
jgi:ethanolamine utilization protein EutQ (cupin superfamily)